VTFKGNLFACLPYNVSIDGYLLNGEIVSCGKMGQEIIILPALIVFVTLAHWTVIVVLTLKPKGLQAYQALF